MIKVLLVDDHELVATGVKIMLESDDDIATADFVDSGEKALQAVKKCRPDVILMDIELPGMNGSEASKRILESYPGLKIICVSQHNKKKLTKQLLDLGVLGFVSKSSPPEEMMRAIRKVLEGETYLSADVAQNIALDDSKQKKNEELLAKLSRRETETMELLLKEKSTKEIAQIMSVKTKTVNTFRHRMFKKLGIKNEFELFRLKEELDDENLKLDKKNDQNENSGGKKTGGQ